MEVPIYIDGERAGALTITRKGGAAAISAYLTDPGRVVRLTLFGERELYLGVPEPAGGMLRLEKSLTPAQAALLPREPKYAAEERIEKKREYRHIIWHGGRAHYF